jgi:hypothetical protein
MIFVAAILWWLVAFAALADAGKIVFVAGTVTIESNGTRPAKVGDPVAVGDTVVTAAASRAQLLMGDGARIALRAGSRFRIDEFTMPANVQKPGTAVAVAANGRSVATLITGGFRTRTGQIGKQDPTAYEVRTPVGTLGIRGTDYTAVFCRNDCNDVPGQPAGQPIPPGLYLAVDEGRIVFTGRGITLDLVAPKVAFIPLDEASYEELKQPPAFLREDGAGALEVRGGQSAKGQTAMPALADRPAGPGNDDDSGKQPGAKQFEASNIEQEVTAVGPNGEPVDLTDGTLPPGRPDIAVAVPPSGNFQPVAANADANAGLTLFNASGALTQFALPGRQGLDTYAIGTASNTNTGSNAATQIRWGRWAGGDASVSNAFGTVALPLGPQSLHWIAGPDYASAPIMPIAGTANYVLVGGTTPTDSAGATGTLLGTSNVAADFTRQVATTTLGLTFPTYSVTATGTSQIGNPQFGLLPHQIQDAFNNVLFTNGQGTFTGLGSYSGYFTGPTNATQPLPPGLALTFALQDPFAGLTVVGTGAFQRQ